MNSETRILKTPWVVSPDSRKGLRSPGSPAWLIDLLFEGCHFGHHVIDLTHEKHKATAKVQKAAHSDKHQKTADFPTKGNWLLKVF
jgi:hypothetical protein